MRRGIEHPEDRIGDVLWLDRLGPGVGCVVTILVTGETHQRELAFAQARLDIADAHASPLQVAAQVQGELFDERLARAIDVATRVRVVAGDGAEIDDTGAAAMGDESRQ
jgi:maleate cis-trans isomerase